MCFQTPVVWYLDVKTPTSEMKIYWRLTLPVPPFTDSRGSRTFAGEQDVLRAVPSQLDDTAVVAIWPEHTQ